MFASVCADFEAELVEFDGEDDHVHLVGELPTESGRFETGQQPERSFQPADQKNELSKHQEEAMGRCFVVAKLLRWKLWWRSDRRYSPVHRTAADAALTSKPRTASPSELSIPALNDGAFRSIPVKIDRSRWRHHYIHTRVGVRYRAVVRALQQKTVVKLVTSL